MFCEEIIELFQKISVALPKPVDYIKTQQIMFIDIGGKWFMDKHKLKLPPIKSTILSKEA